MQLQQHPLDEARHAILTIQNDEDIPMATAITHLDEIVRLAVQSREVLKRAMAREDRGAYSRKD